MDDAKSLHEARKEFIEILTSSEKPALSSAELLERYRALNFTDFPYEQYGFSSADDFFDAIPELYSIPTSTDLAFKFRPDLPGKGAHAGAEDASTSKETLLLPPPRRQSKMKILEPPDSAETTSTLPDLERIPISMEERTTVQKQQLSTGKRVHADDDVPTTSRDTLLLPPPPRRVKIIEPPDTSTPPDPERSPMKKRPVDQQLQLSTSRTENELPVFPDVDKIPLKDLHLIRIASRCLEGLDRLRVSEAHLTAVRKVLEDTYGHCFVALLKSLELYKRIASKYRINFRLDLSKREPSIAVDPEHQSIYEQGSDFIAAVAEEQGRRMEPLRLRILSILPEIDTVTIKELLEIYKDRYESPRLTMKTFMKLADCDSQPMFCAVLQGDDRFKAKIIFSGTKAENLRLRRATAADSITPRLRAFFESFKKPENLNILDLESIVAIDRFMDLLDRRGGRASMDEICHLHKLAYGRDFPSTARLWKNSRIQRFPAEIRISGNRHFRNLDYGRNFDILKNYFAEIRNEYDNRLKPVREELLNILNENGPLSIDDLAVKAGTNFHGRPWNRSQLFMSIHTIYEETFCRRIEGNDVHKTKIIYYRSPTGVLIFSPATPELVAQVFAYSGIDPEARRAFEDRDRANGEPDGAEDVAKKEVDEENSSEDVDIALGGPMDVLRLIVGISDEDGENEEKGANDADDVTPLADDEKLLREEETWIGRGESPDLFDDVENEENRGIADEFGFGTDAEEMETDLNLEQTATDGASEVQEDQPSDSYPDSAMAVGEEPMEVDEDEAGSRRSDDSLEEGELRDDEEVANEEKTVDDVVDETLDLNNKQGEKESDMENDDDDFMDYDSDRLVIVTDEELSDKRETVEQGDLPNEEENEEEAALEQRKLHNEVETVFEDREATDEGVADKEKQSGEAEVVEETEIPNEEEAVLESEVPDEQEAVEERNSLVEEEAPVDDREQSTEGEVLDEEDLPNEDAVEEAAPPDEGETAADEEHSGDEGDDEMSDDEEMSEEEEASDEEGSEEDEEMEDFGSESGSEDSETSEAAVSDEDAESDYSTSPLVSVDMDELFLFPGALKDESVDSDESEASKDELSDSEYSDDDSDESEASKDELDSKYSDSEASMKAQYGSDDDFFYESEDPLVTQIWIEYHMSKKRSADEELFFMEEQQLLLEQQRLLVAEEGIEEGSARGGDSSVEAEDDDGEKENSENSDEEEGTEIGSEGGTEAATPMDEDEKDIESFGQKSNELDEDYGRFEGNPYSHDVTQYTHENTDISMDEETVQNSMQVSISKELDEDQGGTKSSEVAPPYAPTLECHLDEADKRNGGSQKTSEANEDEDIPMEDEDQVVDSYLDEVSNDLEKENGGAEDPSDVTPPVSVEKERFEETAVEKNSQIDSSQSFTNGDSGFLDHKGATESLYAFRQNEDISKAIPMPMEEDEDVVENPNPVQLFDEKGGSEETSEFDECTKKSVEISIEEDEVGDSLVVSDKLNKDHVEKVTPDVTHEKMDISVNEDVLQNSSLYVVSKDWNEDQGGSESPEVTPPNLTTLEAQTKEADKENGGSVGTPGVVQNANEDILMEEEVEKEVVGSGLDAVSKDLEKGESDDESDVTPLESEEKERFEEKTVETNSQTSSDGDLFDVKRDGPRPVPTSRSPVSPAPASKNSFEIKNSPLKQSPAVIEKGPMDLPSTSISSVDPSSGVHQMIPSTPTAASSSTPSSEVNFQVVAELVEDGLREAAARGENTTAMSHTIMEILFKE